VLQSLFRLAGNTVLTVRESPEIGNSQLLSLSGC